MKICCISDLHGNLIDIEPCDVLIISGDICPHFFEPGSSRDMASQSNWLNIKFAQWINNLPVKDVVLTFGNHDFVAESFFGMIQLPSNVHVLMNNHKVVQGLKFFGSPFSPWFYSWAFNSPPDDNDEFLSKLWSSIDHDTDVFVIHGPPAGYGDVAPNGDRTGSLSLSKKIHDIKPILSVHGHIHCGYGVYEYIRAGEIDDIELADLGNIGYIVNASVLNERYLYSNKPIYFEIKDKVINLIAS